ncbi:carotenoid oxygenase family protein [Streptomyces sp. NRRL S-244]|uniref:carotenoid oxygenase family protein n=1 Tax=Streptomyces sp. NRRL S-244 TaxID=1463897 RepID=UPI002D21A2CC|nr:carotenoid oxygenase family protein [Streptomyces sp. NRRL S-244]
MPYRWDEEYGARLGVMSRAPGSTGVRWYDIDPCYVFHVGNAHEDARGRDRAGRGALRRRRVPQDLDGHRRDRGPGRFGGSGRSGRRAGTGPHRGPRRPAPPDPRPGHRPCHGVPLDDRAADATAEDEGRLLSLVPDDGGEAGELLVLDAADLSVQAVVELPHPVPAGFHGSWPPEPAQGS